MSGKLLYLTQQFKQKELAFALLYNSNQLQDIFVLPEKEDNVLLGNIYIGRVKNFAAGIHAAFIEVAPKEITFLPLGDCKAPLLLNRTYDGQLKEGDELVVQITKQAAGTKLASVSTNLTIVGNYFILNSLKHGIHFSSKINAETQKKILTMIPEELIARKRSMGIVVRTNVENLLATKEIFLDELAVNTQSMQNILDNYRHRTCFSCLFQAESDFYKPLRDLPLSSYDEIVTDNANYYERLLSYKEQKGITQKELRLYQDTQLPLHKLYSVETRLHEVLSKQVWLKSGGYLVIEQTEAMAVIDVNSGKSESKRNAASVYFKTNMEAAIEIARQIRLRNLAGIIVVDFINMSSKAEEEQLLSLFAEHLKKDSNPARIIDMTPLGLVELTRKKISKPFGELISLNCKDF